MAWPSQAGRSRRSSSFVPVGQGPLELSSTPHPVAYPNSKSVDKHFSVCKERLKVYQDLGAVALCGKPSLVHPLLAIEKEGRKVRLCLDLSRNLNEKIVKRKFKLQSLKEAVLLSFGSIIEIGR